MRSILECSSSSVIFCILTKLCQENVHMPMKNIFFTHIKLYIATKKIFGASRWESAISSNQQPLNQEKKSTDTQSTYIHLAVSCTVPKPGFSYFLKDMLSAEDKISFWVWKVWQFQLWFFLFPHWKWYYLATRIALWTSKTEIQSILEAMSLLIWIS